MSNRKIRQLVPSSRLAEGAGVTVHRTIGTPPLRNLDPFLMLDHFSSDNPDDYIAGFPDHPHRGFNTFTYMLDGHMRHGDSMGNHGDLEPGGAQWMKAGSGVIHSEMPQQEEGLMRGFQLWINLPAEQKLSEPAYQEIRPEAIPEVADENVRVRVLAGEYAGRQGPVEDPNTRAQYLDVTLAPMTTFTHAVPKGHAVFLYVFEGKAQLADTVMPLHHLAVLSDGDQVHVGAGAEGTCFLLVAGQPIGEPIVQYGPFVMNTQEEIKKAISDYQQGHLVSNKAGMVNAW